LFARDVLYGVRRITRDPGFALAAILSLALGMGANTLVFSVLDSTLLKPIGLHDPERLVLIWNVPDRSRPNELGPSSVSRYFEVRDSARSFDVVSAYNGGGCGVRNLGFDEPGVAAERVFGQTVSPSFFRLLGVNPLIGRTFTEAEDQVVNVAPVAIISHRMWQRRFASDPQILGKALRLDSVPTTIIGVLPSDFAPFGDEIEFFTPLCLSPAQIESKFGANNVIGRLKPGVSIEQAQAEVDTLTARLAQTDPNRHGGLGARVEPLQRAWARSRDANGRPSADYGSLVLILQGAVGFVLLIACANVAGLLLSRMGNRRGELALRVALGASRGRIVRQLLAECLPLALCGGLVGVVLSAAGLSLFKSMAPADFPRLDRLALDTRALVFTALVSLLTTVLFAILPSLQASREPALESLKASGRGGMGDRRRRQVRSLLVAGQVALALVLLVGAGLLIRSFDSAIRRDLGADPTDVLVFDFRMPLNDVVTLKGIVDGRSVWDVKDAAGQKFERVLDQLQTVPGIVSAAAVNVAPFGAGTQLLMPFLIEGQAPPRVAGGPGAGPNSALQTANYLAVTRGFFAVMRTRLVRGRDFDSRDTLDRPAVLIINETMARQFFPSQDAIGKRLTLQFAPNEPSREIVGIVADTAVGALQGNQEPAMYVPHLQQTPQFIGRWVYLRNGMYFVVRASGNPLRLVPSIKRAVLQVDNVTPVADVKTLEQTLDAEVRHLRQYTLLLTMFGVVALVLAATGIYGVIAYSVAERRQEIGVRLALGADTSDVVRLVLAQGLKLVVFGLVFGFGAAVALTRLIQSLLFRVTATDPTTYATVCLLLLIIAAAACAIPLARAIRVNPAVALRQ